ncbi:MAG: hypothetical protein IKB71_11335 [Lentisphaeria bacterium]|nr:hypothetical protein [Lentisphaeria bacterium]
MANFIFVKSTFTEGKQLGSYEGVELKYGENAFKTLDEALAYYNSDAVLNKDYWNDNIFVLDKNVNIGNFSTHGVRIRSYYDADKHKNPQDYKAKNNLNFKDVEFTVHTKNMYFNNFLNVNIENTTIPQLVSILGGTSREDDSGYEYNSKGTANVKNSDICDISGYLNYKIVESEVKGVDGGNQMQKKDYSNYFYDRQQGTQSGYIVFIDTDKMTGNAVVENSSVFGSLARVKTVTAKNSAFNDVYLTTDFVETKTWSYETSDDKIITKTQENITKGKVTGSFTGTNIKVHESGKSGEPGLIGYKTVKLTNAYVNGCIGYLEKSTWASFYKTIYVSSYTYGNEYSTSANRTYLEYDVKATGSFSAVIDKNASKDNEYKLGTINGYKSVTIKGLKDIRYSISQIDGYDIYGQFNGLEQVVWNRTSVGTVKISDTDIGGSVAGFKTVTVTDSDMPINYYFSGGFSGRENADVVQIDKTFGKFTASITDGKDHTLGRVNYFDNVSISGYSKKGVNATLTVGRLSAGEYETYDNDKTYNFIAKGTLKVKNNVVINDYSGGVSIRYFKNVTLENNVRTTGSIKCNTYQDGEYFTNNGTLTMKNNVYIAGAVWGFKTVNMTDSHVDDSVHGEELLKSTFNLSSSSLRTHIDKFNIVNIKKGFNSAISYYGTKHNDTLTIAKDATLLLTGGTEYIMDFGEGKDKFVLNGTLILKQHAPINLEVVSGKGTIACTDSNYEAVVAALPEKYTVEVLNLGNTVDIFVSKKHELGDDTAKKAYKWDMDEEYKGWMAGEGSCDFADTVDFVKFNADEAVSLKFNGGADSNFALTLNGNEISADNFKDFACLEGTNILEIRREIGGSTTYSLSVVENV